MSIKDILFDQKVDGYIRNPSQNIWGKFTKLSKDI